MVFDATRCNAMRCDAMQYVALQCHGNGCDFNWKGWDGWITFVCWGSQEDEFGFISIHHSIIVHYSSSFIIIHHHWLLLIPLASAYAAAHVAAHAGAHAAAHAASPVASPVAAHAAAAHAGTHAWSCIILEYINMHHGFINELCMNIVCSYPQLLIKYWMPPPTFHQLVLSNFALN